MRVLLLSLRVVSTAWRNVASAALRLSIWKPFLLIAFVQTAVLLLIVSFHHQLLLPVALPIIRLLAGEEVAHYPVLFIALPVIHFRIRLVITILIASIATGAATALFARAYGLDEDRSPWRRALRSAPSLMAISLLVIAAWFGISMLGSLVPHEMQMRSSSVRWATRGVLLLLSLLVQCLLIYTTAWIVIAGHKIGPAIRDSVRVSLRTFLPTLIAVGIPTLVLFPSSIIGSRAGFIADKFKPEMIGWLLGGTVVLEVLMAFLIVGTITRLFVWRMGESR